MITRMSEDETRALLSSNRLARLGCIVDEEPYVVPVNYLYQDGSAYIHSLPGNKVNALRARKRACLQVDVIEGDCHWKSALAYGDFEEITNRSERSQLMDRILKSFPMLTPVESAIIDDAQPQSVILFRIRIDRVSGVREG